MRALQGNAAETTQLSVRYGVNTGDWLIQPTMHNPDIPLPTGQTHYWERMNDSRLRIASPSFAQVNTPQAELLADLVRERLRLSGAELLVDAYAGVGTFAVLLADSARHVIAIEESSAAVADAAVNIEGIDNLEFVCSRTEDYLDSLSEPPDAVILDPPRVGCHPDDARSPHPPEARANRLCVLRPRHARARPRPLSRRRLRHNLRRAYGHVPPDLPYRMRRNPCPFFRVK